MKNRLKTFLIAATVASQLLILTPVAAQTQKIRFERLAIEDGLSQNAILTIAQDTQGFL